MPTRWSGRSSPSPNDRCALDPSIHRPFPHAPRLFPHAARHIHPSDADRGRSAFPEHRLGQQLRWTGKAERAMPSEQAGGRARLAPLWRSRRLADLIASPAPSLRRPHRLADLADLSASPPSSLCRPRRSAALVALITAGLAALVATRRDPTGRL